MLKIALVRIDAPFDIRLAGGALEENAPALDDEFGDARCVATLHGIVHLLGEGGLARIGKSKYLCGPLCAGCRGHHNHDHGSGRHLHQSHSRESVHEGSA